MTEQPPAIIDRAMREQVLSDTCAFSIVPLLSMSGYWREHW